MTLRSRATGLQRGEALERLDRVEDNGGLGQEWVARLHRDGVEHRRQRDDVRRDELLRA